MSDSEVPSGIECGGEAEASLRRVVTICNRRGLHARAAAKFVTLADQYRAEIEVKRGSSTVSGRSIMGLMMLTAGPGSQITISAKGAEAERALDAIVKLVEAGFDEN